MTSPQNNSNQTTPGLKSQLNTGFWHKADRLAVMIAGGAALGSAIAQLPGAIVGGFLAAGYGWYINTQTQSGRNF